MISEAFTENDSVMSRINFDGNAMKISCNPLKLIQFLLIELKSKLKSSVPNGSYN